MDTYKLDVFFDEVIEVFVIDLAFYIPSDIIPTSLLEELEGSIPEGYFNELTILDPLGFAEFEIDEFYLRLIKKKTKLEKNIFKLLEKKSTTEKIEFEYILNKYFKQLEFYLAITNWLSVNLKNYNPEKVNLTTIGSFEMQYDIYKSHFDELLQRFQPFYNFSIKEEFTISELLKDYFPEMITRYQMTSVKENDISETQNNTSIKNESSEPPHTIELEQDNKLEMNSTPKKKKEKLKVDYSEVEIFLLETVFNITSPE